MNPRLVACILVSSLIGWSAAVALFMAGAGLIGAYLLGSLCASFALVAASLLAAPRDARGSLVMPPVALPA